MKEINSLGPEKLVCYIRYFVISDLFISSFHCIRNYSLYFSLDVFKVYLSNIDSETAEM